VTAPASRARPEPPRPSQAEQPCPSQAESPRLSQAEPRCPSPAEPSRSSPAEPPHPPLAEVTDEPVTERLLDDRARAVRDKLRVLLDAEVAPAAAGYDQTGEFAGPSYQALARAGLAGLLFPGDLGGTGDSAVTYAMAVAEIAARCAATSLIYMTQMHAGYPVMLAGTAGQQRRWIPALCAGTIYGSLAITEPGAGSDMASLTTTARRQPGGYRLNGSKTFITNGDVAGLIVVFATVDRAAGRRGITAFLVPGDAPGLSRGRVLKKMGMRGSSTAELFFEDMDLPESARLGEEGQGWSISLRSVVKSRLSAAAQGVGIATRAYQIAAQHHHERNLADQAGAFDLADMRTRLLTGRALLLATAAAIDGGTETIDAQVAAMKLWCTDLGVELADRACDLLGADGDLAGREAERLLRDAKVTQIYDGTNEIQRLIIARDSARRQTGQHQAGQRQTGRPA
jgi:alkylation response protein AidB-like acyl-CoA dehydrogenase